MSTIADRPAMRAMGTDLHVVAPGHERAVRGLFVQWEATLSRFLPLSDVSRANQAAGTAVEVSPLTVTVVETALAAARATGGLYDPCLGAHMEEIGYATSWSARRRWDDVVVPGVAPAAGRWREVRLDRAGRRLTVPRGARLDLGGIAKGMAVDAAAAMLRARGVPRGLISAGGDLAVWGTPPGEPGWPVDLPDTAGAVCLVHGALATSGTLRRRWNAGGEAVHHVIDPRTGRPSTGDAVAVTVLAERLVHAEVAATAALVLGTRRGIAFLAQRGLEARFIDGDGVVTTTGGWPGEEGG